MSPGGTGEIVIPDEVNFMCTGLVTVAPFFGSTGSVALARPVVGMTPTSDARGYWMVASDGGVFAFGDAPFEGSEGGTRLVAPMVGMGAPPLP